MLYHIEECGKYAEITGYKKVNFFQAEEFLKARRKQSHQDVEVQFFDAGLIATQEHVYFALLNALKAFQNKTNISKSFAMETMLYASAQRQIKKAIQLCGIKPETSTMAVMLLAENPNHIEMVLQEIKMCIGVEPDEKVLKMTKSKEDKIIETFQITDKEINTIMNNHNHSLAVINLVIERIALLATQL